MTVPDWLFYVLIFAVPAWMLLNFWLAVDAGRRWGWVWGVGLWLILPVAIVPWILRRRGEAKSDRDAGVRRPVGA